MIQGYAHLWETSLPIVFDGGELTVYLGDPKHDDLWYKADFSGGLVLDSEIIIAYCGGETFAILVKPMHRINKRTLYFDVHFVLKLNAHRMEFSGIDFFAKELDSIYPPEQFYSRNFSDERTFKSLTVDGSPISSSRRIELDGLEVDTSFSIRHKYPQGGRCPIELIPVLSVKSARPLQYEDVRQILVLVKRYLGFLSYSAEVHIEGGKLRGKNRYGEQTDVGEIVYLDEDFAGYSEQKSHECLKHNLISDETRLIQDLFSDCLYLHHLPQTYKHKSRLSIERYITVLAGFEHEYRRMHNGKSPNRSSRKPEYLEVKGALETLAAEATQNKVKSIYGRLIDDIDTEMLARKIKVAFTKYEQLLIERMQKLYKANQQVFKKGEFWDRVAGQRNRFAHGNIDQAVADIAWLDFLVMEQLLVTMQLSFYIDNEDGISKALSLLFD